MIFRKYVVTFASNSTKIHFSHHAPGRALDALEKISTNFARARRIPRGYRNGWLRSAYSPENSEESPSAWPTSYKVIPISRIVETFNSGLLYGLVFNHGDKRLGES